MINLRKIQNYLVSTSELHNFQAEVKTHGYAFTNVMGNESLKYFEFTDLRVLIDFDHSIYYWVDNEYNVISLANHFSEFEFSLVINLYNSYSRQGKSVMLEIYKILKQLY